MTETVTRIRAGASVGTDAFGVPIPGSDVETDITGALFAPGGTSEPVEVGREATVSAPTLYFRDARPDFVRTDRVRVRGVVYELDGDPADWRNGDSHVGGLVVTLRRAGG